MMEGVNSNVIYLIYYENICKCHNISPPAQQLKKEKKIENRNQTLDNV
jgi:hypothetical protein